MCLRCVTIANPSRRFVSGLSAPLLQVPCGKCSECESASQDEWFVRAQMEYVRCCRAGGEVWFPTLTFNDEHLPMWHDDRHNYHVPCMNPIALKRFRDAFRVNLSRYKNPLTDDFYDVSGIRFEIVTEYGSQYGRVHHHCLMFVPFKVPESIMVDCIERAWAYRLESVYDLKTSRNGKTYRKYRKDSLGHTIQRRVPKNGFVMWSKQGKKILSARGIRYVQKYISKPQSWLKEYGIEKYEQLLKDEIVEICKRNNMPLQFTQSIRDSHIKYLLDRGEFFKTKSEFFHAYPHSASLDDRYSSIFDRQNLELYEAIDCLRRFRAVKPKHLQSTFFGIDGLDYFRDSEGNYDVDKIAEGKINLGDSRYGEFRFIDMKHPNFRYNLPRYYQAKLFLERDEYGLYVKNELFDMVYAKRFNDVQKRLCDSLQPYFQTKDVFLSHLAGIDRSKEELEDLYTTIHDLMDGRSVSDFALFVSCYQNRKLSEGIKFIENYVSPAGFGVSSLDDVLSNDDTMLRVLRECALPYSLDARHLECFNPVPMPERFRCGRFNRQFNPDDTFNELHCYYDFDIIFSIIQELELDVCDMIDMANRKRVEDVSKILSMTMRDIFYMSNPDKQNSYE